MTKARWRSITDVDTVYFYGLGIFMMVVQSCDFVKALELEIIF